MGNKYSARKTGCNNGHMHASGKEARRCNDLHLLQQGRAISDLAVEPQFWFTIHGVQVKHPNGRRAGFKPDFRYIENGRYVVEDVKGGNATKTEAFALRWALARAMWPEIEWRLV